MNYILSIMIGLCLEFKTCLYKVNMYQNFNLTSFQLIDKKIVVIGMNIKC